MNPQINANRLLSTLASREPTHPIIAQLRPVSLVLGQILVTASLPVQSGLFITKGMACGATLMNDGTTTADELLGPEGFVGMSLLFGTTKMQPVTVIVKIAGTAMRIDAPVFLQEFNKGGIFRDMMLSYAFSRMVSMSQAAACNTLHCIQERMACCLLRTADRVGAEFKLTHESIAEMLGNRRATVTTQLEAFRRLNFISCGYGRIRIENRRALETFACECYQVRKNAFENACKL